MFESAFRFVHDPENAKEMAEVRRLGGLRKRKEKAVQGAFDVEGLDDAQQIRRLLMIAAVDVLSLDNTIARSRTLVLVAQAAAKLLEAHALEQRLQSLEATLKPREPAQARFAPQFGLAMRPATIWRMSSASMLFTTPS